MTRNSASRARLILIVAGIATTFTTPASAQTPSGNAYAMTSPSGPTLARPSNESSQARQPRAEQPRRICVRDTLTGSRLPRQICRTAEEWEALGGLSDD